jgi:hypothetical protein
MPPSARHPLLSLMGPTVPAKPTCCLDIMAVPAMDLIFASVPRCSIDRSEAQIDAIPMQSFEQSILAFHDVYRNQR